MGMGIWNGYIILLTSREIKIFALPSEEESVRHIQTISVFAQHLEVQVVNPKAVYSSYEGLLPSSQARPVPFTFLAVSERGIGLSALHQKKRDNTSGNISSESPFFLRVDDICLHTKSEQWYRLRSGITGSRTVHISGPTLLEKRSPLLLGSTFQPRILPVICAPLSFSTNATDFLRNCTGNLDQVPAMWAIPILDFDEALGFLAVGNQFGELALYDYVGFYPPELASISETPKVSFSDYSIVPTASSASNLLFLLLIKYRTPLRPVFRQSFPLVLSNIYQLLLNAGTVWTVARFNFIPNLIGVPTGQHGSSGTTGKVYQGTKHGC